MRKRRGPKIDPCGMPVLINAQEEAEPGSTTLCFLSFK